MLLGCAVRGAVEKFPFTSQSSFELLDRTVLIRARGRNGSNDTVNVPEVTKASAQIKVQYASHLPGGTLLLVTLKTGKQSRAALKASAKALPASLPGVKVAEGVARPGPQKAILHLRRRQTVNVPARMSCKAGMERGKCNWAQPFHSAGIPSD
jgi:hypothetical protein